MYVGYNSCHSSHFTHFESAASDEKLQGATTGTVNPVVEVCLRVEGLVHAIAQRSAGKASYLSLRLEKVIEARAGFAHTRTAGIMISRC